MEKSQKKANKKKQPLKVVYITNPMKFKTSASEFRALVQELTGQDAGTLHNSSTSFSTVKVAAGDNVHADQSDQEEVMSTKSEEQPSGGVTAGDDSFFSSLLIESFQGLDDSNLLDVLTSLDAM